MIKVYKKEDLEEYLKDDWVLEKLKNYPEDNESLSQKWLLDLPEKRMIYADVYGEFLKSKNPDVRVGAGKKILDVGGGFCGLSRVLTENHDYTLIDMIQEGGGKDWTEFKPEGKYDYVISNDLFPNVDQRLRKFLEIYKPHAEKIILTLTCHEGERAYKVKRVDAEEVLTIVPWNATFTSIILGEELPPQSPELSIFKNGRTVYRVDL